MSAKKKRRTYGTGTLDMKRGKYYAVFSIRDTVTGKRNRQYIPLRTSDRKEAERLLKKHSDEYCMKGASVDPKTTNRKLLADREQFQSRLEEKSNSLAYQKRILEKKRVEEEERKLAEKNKLAEEQRKNNAISVGHGFTFFAMSKKRADCSERTLKGYETQYTIFTDWMGENYPSIKKVYEITSDMAESFLNYITKKRSRNTRNKYLTCLRMIWKNLLTHPDSLITKNPWDGIKPLKEIPDTLRHKDLSTGEIRRVFQSIMSDEMSKPLSFIMRPSGNETFEKHTVNLRDEIFTLFVILLYTACRLGDAVTLRKESISFEENTVRIKPRKTNRNYGWEITIPMHRALKAHLQVKDFSGTGYLLPHLAYIYLNREPSIIVNRTQQIFRAAGLETNVAPPEISGGTRKRVPVGCHSFRHTVKSVLANANYNEDIVNYLLCHKQSEVQARYYHANKSALASAINAIPTIPEVLPPDSTELSEWEDSSKRENIISELSKLDSDTLKEVAAFLARRTRSVAQSLPV